MTKYIIKRIAMGLLSIFIVATLTFFLMNLVPGGPFVAEKSISKAAQEALAAKYGLDKPLFEQYITYITDFIKGDMGVSLRQRGRTVSDIIFSKFPVSAKLAGIAVLVSLLVGIPLGCLSAYNRGKFADNFIIVLATCGIAIPSFIISVILLYTFGSKLNLLPTVGLNTLSSYIMPVTGAVGLPYGIYNAAYALKSFGRYGAGLYKNGKSQRPFKLQNTLQACSQKRNTPRNNIRRTNARKPYDGFVYSRTDICNTRSRP